MKYLQYATLLAAAVWAVVTPETLQKKPVKIDFTVLRGDERSTAKEGAEAALVKREGRTELSLVNRHSYYAATLRIGSHGAENSVTIDTGSSDLWVMSSNVRCSSSRRNSKREVDELSAFSHRRLMDYEISELTPDEDKNKRADITGDIGSGGSARGSCTASGSFDTGASNSFNRNATAPSFSIRYADNTFANGFWGTDFIGFSGLNVSDCSFAVASDTSSDTGVFGIGFAGLETTSSVREGSRPYTYENFPLRLKATDAIKKTLYSLYLNSAEALSGSVLFGAVDHAKYTGQLQTVPIINIYPRFFRNPIRFDIVLSSIDLESSSQNITISSSHVPALLDSGTTLTYLPSVMLRSFAALLGGSLGTSGFYRVSCRYNTKAAFAVFDFSGVKIKVPMSDLILTVRSQCLLGLRTQEVDNLTGASYAVLGDNVIRNAYIVYDLEDNEIALAQVNYTPSENIETVTSSIPLAVKAARYSQTGVVSSVDSNPVISHLSSSGFQRSQGSYTYTIQYAKSMLLGMLVMCFAVIF